MRLGACAYLHRGHSLGVRSDWRGNESNGRADCNTRAAGLREEITNHGRRSADGSRASFAPGGFAEDAIDEQDELLRIEWLGQEVVSTQFHRLDGVLDRAV